MRALPLVFLLILALFMALGLFRHADRQASRLIGQPIAAFNLPMLGAPSKSFSLEHWKGKVVVLNVFASWCESCAVEHTALMGLAGKVALVGLAWKDTPEKTAAWLAEHGNPYKEVGVDASGKTTLPLALTGVPETFVIGRDGRIAYNSKTALNQTIIESDILPLVEKLSHE